MGGTLLITSACYVGPELAAEFGRIPPAFLPVGNRRLYTWQIAEAAAHFDRIALSLPTDFELPPFDAEALDAAGVMVMRASSDVTLHRALLGLLPDLPGEGLAILHGDTLIRGTEFGATDAMSVDVATSYYHWAVAQVDAGQITRVHQELPDGGGEQSILTGFFHFADRALIQRCLEDADGFVAAIDGYLRIRAMRALSARQWLDFGHVHTYYASRGGMTTERAFNALTIARRVVHKSSDHVGRIDAEAGWYENIPAELGLFTPRYIGRTDTGYRVEFLPNASLADLFVFGDVAALTWRAIFAACETFVEECRRHPAPAAIVDETMALYLPKTLSRLADYARQANIDLDRSWTLNGRITPSLTAIARSAAARIRPPQPGHLSIVHGDLCFSNILYDFRSRAVWVIDPRGQDASGRPTIFGDNRYDLAKLHHSVHGLYDLIVSGMARIESDSDGYALDLELPLRPSMASAAASFDAMIDAHFATDRTSIEAISLLLFLSMLPLHSDDPQRQRALLANALRLHLDQAETP